MAINLVAPAVNSLLPIDGVGLDWAEAGVCKANRKDVLLVHIAESPTVAGMFTQNRFCTAPVQIHREHLADDRGARAIVVNMGNVNAGIGALGPVHTRQTCDAVAKLLGVSPEQVLSFFMGVALEPLLVDRVIAGLPVAEANARLDNWLAVAGAIMITDTVPKAASVTCMLSGKTVHMLGISKGASTIRPNMATMLGLIAANANVDDAVLQGLVRRAVDRSFSSMTVDGDTSISDLFVAITTGRVGTPRIDSESHPDYVVLRDTLADLAQGLTQKIMCDDESATEFMAIQVESGHNIEECRLIAYAIAHSPLVKTAFYASDPNLGCILAVIGYASMTDLDVNGVNLWLDDI